MARQKTNGSKESSATIGFEAKLWLAADKLRKAIHRLNPVIPVG